MLSRCKTPCGRSMFEARIPRALDVGVCQTVQVKIRPDTDGQVAAIEAFVQATPEGRARLLSPALVTSSILAQMHPALLVIGESPQHAAN